MSEVVGGIGAVEHGIETLTEQVPLLHTQRWDSFHDDSLEVAIASGASGDGSQPYETDDGSLVWVIGTPYGSLTDEDYLPREDFTLTDAAYVGRLFERHGLIALETLNGEFICIVATPAHDSIHLFTDRLGSIPLFYSMTADASAVLFSTRLQPLGIHPEVSTAFDPEMLSELFSVQKVFGTATPLVGVRKVPPGSVLSVDVGTVAPSMRTYWRPRYRPIDRSPSAIAADIADTFQTIVAERLRDDRSYGLMLSGGSDSRLVLASMLSANRAPITYHLTNWRSMETRITERVADEAAVELKLLERDRDYHERLLSSVPEATNFVGAFDQSIATGFASALADVDVVVTGYLGDTLFGRYPLYLPTPTYPVPARFEHQVNSVSEYIARYLDRYATPAIVPEFLDTPPVDQVLKRHIEQVGSSVFHHGIQYGSLRELQLFEYYPLTNQFASSNTDSIRRITEHWSPFFDIRLLDLHLTVPVATRIRSNLIDHGVTKVSPELASIPHATTRMPLTTSTGLHPRFLISAAKGILHRQFRSPRPPAAYLGHGPWMDEAALIREHDFIGRTIERNTDVIDGLSFLDRDAIDTYYQAHLDGENHWRGLYILATLLESPIAHHLSNET